MSWASQRKLLYLLVLLIILGMGVLYMTYPLFNKEPTCTDRKQNGGESGIDCGGPCQLLCREQLAELNVKWVRSFEVTKGVYDTVAYVENRNIDAGIQKLLYRIKLYNDKNLVIAERDGKTFIGSNRAVTIFEPGIRTGEGIPKKAFIEFEDISWTRTDPRAGSVNISVKNQKFENASTTPRLYAEIINDSLVKLVNLELVALLYGFDDNVITASSATLDSLKSRSFEQVYFTWLKPIDKEVARIEIVPHINPFTLSF
jgi:hypothetical protein